MIETRATRDARGEVRLLGLFGAELATVYRDTLQAPLPASLRTIVDRLEISLADLDRKPGRAG